MDKCPMCGQPVPPEATECPNCKTAVGSGEAPPAPPPPATSPRGPKPRSLLRCLGVLVGVAALVIVVFAVREVRTRLPVSDPAMLVPKSVPIAAEVCLKEVWKTVEPFIRESSTASQGLKQFEQQTKLSIAGDLLPCFRDSAAIGVSMSSGGLASPGVVGVAPLSKDWRKVYSVVKRLYEQGMKPGAPAALKTQKYHGVRFWTQGAAPGQPASAFGFLRGCAVVASDESAMKKVIDVGLKRSPSLVAAPGFSQVKRSLPKEYVIRWYYDFKELMRAIPQGTVPGQMKAIEAIGGYGGTVSFPDGRVRLDVAISASDKAPGKEMVASWKKCNVPISGATLSYLPFEPLLIYSLSNLAEMQKQFAKSFDPQSLALMPPNVKTTLDTYGKAVPKEGLVKLCSALAGESSLAVSYLPDKKKVVCLFVSEAGNEASLRSALEDLDVGLAARGIAVQKATHGNALLRTISIAGPQPTPVAYAQLGAVLIASNNPSSVRGCIDRKQSGAASAASNKALASARAEVGKDASSLTYLALYQLKSFVPAGSSAAGGAKASAVLDRLGVVTGGGHLVNDIYVGNMVTSALLKDIVEAFKLAGTLFQESMMKGAGAGFPQGPAMGPASQLVGKAAPDFAVKDVQGKQWQLSKLRGKVVVLDFFATWCPPCRQELPLLQKVARQFADKPVQFLILSNESPEVLKPFLTKERITLPALTDPSNAVSPKYSVSGIPQVCVIDAKGRVQSVHVGFSPQVETTLTKELETLLAGKSLPSPAAAPPAPAATMPPFTPGPSPPSGGSFPQALEQARTASCASNVKQLALGMLMYVQDYDERFPMSRRWNDAIDPYVRNRSLLACPSYTRAQFGYAMNANLDRLALSAVAKPYDVGSLFDSSAGRADAADKGQSWCQPPRHQTGNNAAYVDGHVKLVSQRPNFDPRK